MKKSFFLLCFILFASLAVFGQEVSVPQGMKFQAVARDLGGRLLASRPVNLQVSLLSMGTEAPAVFYTENQNAATNNLGLFELTIGQGKLVSGDFSAIPWASEEIWIEFKIDENNSGDYKTVSRSRLLAVPYAFHAATAGKIVGGGTTPSDLENCGGGSVIGTVWSINSNCATPTTARIGTADFKQLKVVTNALERWLVKPTGQSYFRQDVFMDKNGKVGIDLIVDRNMYVHNNLTVDFKTTTKELVVNYPDASVLSDATTYPAEIKGMNAGLSIKVDGSRSNDTWFMTFFDNDGVQGRIEGQTAGEKASDPEYIFGTLIRAADVAMGIIDIAGAAASANICVGAGAVGCPPVPSLNIAAVANAVIQGAKLIGYEAFAFAHLGVDYSSSAGDYAEWLERADPSEKMTFGEIVGVRGGKISKNTKGAEQLMVISKAPIVLGNEQTADKKPLFEKVAFMGQVPVRVLGDVAVGDYILAAGTDNGLGIGKKTSAMRPADYTRIVGVAWSACMGGGMVNLAVGLNKNDVARLAQQQQKQLGNQKTRLTSLENEMADIKNALRTGGKITPSAPVEIVVSNASAEKTNAEAVAFESMKKALAPPAASASMAQMPANFQSPTMDEINPAFVEEGFVMAKKLLLAEGDLDLNTPTMQSLFNPDGELHILAVAKMTAHYKTIKADFDAINARN